MTKQEFQIGGHRFSTEEEYRQAQKDYEYSKQFMDKLDLKDPKMALNLYCHLEQSEYLMKTSVGEAFKEKLVRVFVQQEVSEIKRKLEEKEYQPVRKIVQHAKNDVHFLWYFRTFLSVSGMMGAYTTFSLWLGLQTDEFVIQHIAIYELWLKFSVYGERLVSMMILGSLGLVGWYFVERVKRKPGTTHRLNLLMLQGGMLCIYLVVFARLKALVFLC